MKVSNVCKEYEDKKVTGISGCARLITVGEIAEVLSNWPQDATFCVSAPVEITYKEKEKQKDLPPIYLF
jgi:hypothetical protein